MEITATSDNISKKYIKHLDILIAKYFMLNVVFSKVRKLYQTVQVNKKKNIFKTGIFRMGVTGSQLAKLVGT